MNNSATKTKTFWASIPIEFTFPHRNVGTFLFYGVRPLLILFMSAALLQGGMELPIEQASAIVGIFAGGVYITSLPGGWLADNWLGQRRAVWYGSLIIAFGHLSIAMSAFYQILSFSLDYYSSYWVQGYLKPVLP